MVAKRSIVTMIGVISDTHGLVRPEAIDALKGVERIIHAGDIGSPDVLRILQTIAPVIAVRGNNDRDEWAEVLPVIESVDVGAHRFYVLHELDRLDIDLEAADYSAVIFGHSHKPVAERRKGVLYLNPGSAGPRRFRLPVTLARLHIRGRELESELIELIPARVVV
ncbi:MAG: YfcE family phosphodiesterase [Nitrospirales bacterium]|nr:YfcE family phosphodiesterase [Nitrospirales bacterium]